MRKLVMGVLTVVNPRIPANLSGRRPQKHWAVSLARRRPPSASEGSPKDIGTTVFEIYRRRGKGRAPRASQSSSQIPRRAGVFALQNLLVVGFPGAVPRRTLCAISHLYSTPQHLEFDPCWRHRNTGPSGTLRSHLYGILNADIGEFPFHALR